MVEVKANYSKTRVNPARSMKCKYRLLLSDNTLERSNLITVLHYMPHKISFCSCFSIVSSRTCRHTRFLVARPVRGTVLEGHRNQGLRRIPGFVRICRGYRIREGDPL